ncbi:MAG: DUF3098 domain-containing protein [Candidatus Limimorpha sp.]
MANQNVKEKEVRNEANNENEPSVMPFGKINYILVLVGIAVIALGFILMVGGGSKNPDVFNDKMFDFQRLTLAPILVLLGFVIEIVAIMKRPLKK